jgi:heme A synthase
MLPPKWQAVHPFSAHRYSLVPNIIVMLLLLERVELSRDLFRRGARVLCAPALLLALLGGIRNYRDALLVRDGWPRFCDEVAARQHDHSRPIRIWPAGWKMRLADDRRNR